MDHWLSYAKAILHNGRPFFEKDPLNFWVGLRWGKGEIYVTKFKVGMLLGGIWHRLDDEYKLPILYRVNELLDEGLNGNPISETK